MIIIGVLMYYGYILILDRKQELSVKSDFQAEFWQLGVNCQRGSRESRIESRNLILKLDLVVGLDFRVSQ